jgi:hypothetical protein
MFIRTFALLLFLASVALAQQPTPIVPDPMLTPGDSFPVTVQDLCVPGYTKKVRNVPAEMKREVYEEYGVTSHGPGDYEVDHLNPLELGGSNSIKNLWPESHRTSPWNAQVKDRLEGKLHALLCAGRLDLKTAQQLSPQTGLERINSMSAQIHPSRGLLRPPLPKRRSTLTKCGSTPKAGSIGSPVRNIMVKPSRANICPKKRRSRKGIFQRMELENDYDCES